MKHNRFLVTTGARARTLVTAQSTLNLHSAWHEPRLETLFHANSHDLRLVGGFLPEWIETEHLSHPRVQSDPVVPHRSSITIENEMVNFSCCRIEGYRYVLVLRCPIE